jgi:hypothetical protein
LVIFSFSAWYEATGRKRPHSPAGDSESAHNNNVREPVSKGAGTPVLWLVRYLTGCAEKRHKKEQLQELDKEQESDGEEITKKSGVYSIPGRFAY